MTSLSSILETSHKIPNLDYMHLFQVTSAISSSKEELYEAYSRMCFNVLLINKDDHGKNFSFIYDEEEKSYSLSPAYDFTKTAYRYEREMTVLGATNATKKDLIAITKEMSLSMERCLAIIKKMESEQ